MQYNRRIIHGSFSKMLFLRFLFHNRIVKFNLLSVLVVVFCMTGCNRVIDDGMVHGRRGVVALLDSVERVIDYNPAYADSLIKRIDPNSIRSKEQKARYALFYTAAQYKNFLPVTSDSLIMEAVRFYSINKNLDHRFLSYYNLGCVYVELGKLTDASVALAQAEQLAYRIDNDYWRGLLYSQLGGIFYESCDFLRAESYFSMAQECYECAGRELHRINALYDIGKCEKGKLRFKEADSLIRIVQDWAVDNNDKLLYDAALRDRFSCFILMKETDSASVLYNEYISKLEEPKKEHIFYDNMALYYSQIGDYEKSEIYLEKGKSRIAACNDSVYWYYASSLVAESKGETELSLNYFRRYTSLQNSELRAMFREPVLGAQKDHYRIIAENESLKSKHAVMTLVLCVIIFLLILVIVLVTYHYKKKRMKEQLFDSLTVVDDLSDKIEQLKNQVRVQFHERHDMSNRLYSMYFDSESQDKITKQQLTVTINSLIKEYTAPDSVRKLDALINESYDGIMERLSAEELGLSDKELQLLRFSFAGLSSKSVSVIIRESPQNIYQIKSRLLKRVRKNSEELWTTLSNIL